MADEVTRYERRGAAGWITLASPQTRNALATQMVAELGARLRAAIEDDAVRAVVLTGEGPAFCAGADLKSRGAMGETSAGNPFVGILKLMRHGPKPVIAAVNGHAFGGGVGLVAAADIAIAVDSALFSFSEVRIGAIPAMISVVVLPKLGEHQTMRLFLTGERFDAARALGYGLLHRVVAPGGLEAAVAEEIGRSRRAAPMPFARQSSSFAPWLHCPRTRPLLRGEEDRRDLRLRGGCGGHGRVRAEAAAPLGAGNSPRRSSV